MFNKFAVLITSTVAFSLIFSFFGFGSLVHLCGPVRNCGSIKCFNRRKYDQVEEIKVAKTLDYKAPPSPKKIGKREGTLKMVEPMSL